VKAGENCKELDPGLDAHRTLADLLGDVNPTIDSLFHEEPTPPLDIPARHDLAKSRLGTKAHEESL